MNKSNSMSLAIPPIEEPVQRAEIVYKSLLDGIMRGELELGAQLNADAIAQHLKVSTTPVRDALNRLEKDGLVVKLPYQGWFVRQFQEQEIRDLYEVRAGLECLGVRLACDRITAEEIERLRDHQHTGEEALEHEDLDAYRLYNQELHAIVMNASRNSELATVMAYISRKTQMLSARTIRMLGRPPRAVREHKQLIQYISMRNSLAAQQLMEHHILSAMEDILLHGLT